MVWQRRGPMIAAWMLLAGLFSIACVVPPMDCQLSMAGVEDIGDIAIGDPLPDDAVLVVTADDIDPTATRPTVDDMGGAGIEVRLRPGGAQRLREYTEGHIGGALLIANRGTIVSTPTIRSAIPDGALVLSAPTGDEGWMAGFRECMPVEVIGEG